MRLLSMELDILPPGYTHNDVARIRIDREAFGLDPDWLPQRRIYYALEIGEWRIDWYDLWAHRLGWPEIHRRGHSPGGWR